jgi:hypothetical protein
MIIGSEERTTIGSSIPPSEASKTPVPFTAEELHALISERAYFIAQRRGFVPGHDLDDWLEAEAEVLDHLSAP